MRRAVAGGNVEPAIGPRIGQQRAQLEVRFARSLSISRCSVLAASVPSIRPELKWLFIEPDHPKGAGILEPDRKVS